MNYPKDFSWKQRLVVNSPKIASAFAGTMLVAAGIAMLDKGLNFITASYSLLVSAMAISLMLAGHGLTLAWKENLQEEGETQ